jgi:hypothetical protein
MDYKGEIRAQRHGDFMDNSNVSAFCHYDQRLYTNNNLHISIMSIPSMHAHKTLVDVLDHKIFSIFRGQVIKEPFFLCKRGECFVFQNVL